MALKTRKALFAALQTLEGARVPKTYKGLSDETYGSKSIVYPSFVSLEARVAGEKKLKELGFKVDFHYGQSNLARTAVQVSYFKGWHWDV